MILVIDLETYYDNDYSLSKISMVEYIRHPLFKIHGFSYQVLAQGVDSTCHWVTGDDMEPTLRALPWSSALVVAHNAKFDLGCLEHHYPDIVQPKLRACTASMANAVIGTAIPRLSLDACAQHFGLPGKVKGALAKVKGDRDPSPELMAQLGEYCNHDTWLCGQIFLELARTFPRAEYKHVDWTIKNFTMPCLALDKGLLEELKAEAVAAQTAMVRASGVTKTILRSNPKFATALTDLGVDPPVKESGRTGKPTFAFSKQDAEFLDLLNHPDERVQQLVKARLAVKTSIDETRAASYLRVAETGTWPVDLWYSGAKTTHRYSGGSGGGGNPQNTPKKSGIRRAIMAPPGYRLLVADLAGIELRVSSFMTGVPALMQALLDPGGDPYVDFATAYYGWQVTKEHQKERQFGKVALLALQYGVGPARFQAMARTQYGLEVTEQEADYAVQLYRANYLEVPNMWRRLSNLLPTMHELEPRALIPGRIDFLRTGDNSVVLPSGLAIKYNDLRYDSEERQWLYTSYSKSNPGGIAKIYGGKMHENISQAVAGEIFKHHLMEVDAHYPVLMQVHDEMVVLVRDDPEEITRATSVVEGIMSMSPSWWPELPLKVEIDTAYRYGDAK